ncbi:META domain-containing protein [Nocardia sp. CNY236]|uniref:META domain-containing protein n=1 Tax=Nocardia sp. CNY236 TaxID=1169152 RepID=UPI000404F505|nr:META domain-containing protein [Nocardia sp. CNY236]
MAVRITLLGPIVLFACGVIAGCSADTPDSGADEPNPMGRTFVSVEVDGTPIPGGGPMTIGFTDDRIVADAGCNTLNGAVDMGDHLVRVSGVSTTLMGCPTEREGADEWLNGLLSAEPRWQLDGATLTLHGTDRTVILVDKKRAQPDKPIQGTQWQVTALSTDNAEIRARVIEEVRPTLLIAEDGSISGTTGCNRMFGRADTSPADGAGPDLSATEITFHITTTEMACPPEVMDLEQAVLRALDGTTTATVDADTLTLRNANGAGLVLRAR